MSDFHNGLRQLNATQSEEGSSMLSFHIALELYKKGIRFYRGISAKIFIHNIQKNEDLPQRDQIVTR